MDILNCYVAIGGDKKNTVPKYRITVAEAAVLRAIHGEDAVHDIVVVGQAKINDAEEIDRLRDTYRALDDERRPIVNLVYPGSSPRLHKTIEELGLPDQLMKTDAKPPPKPKKEIDVSESALFG